MLLLQFILIFFFGIIPLYRDLTALLHIVRSFLEGIVVVVVTTFLHFKVVVLFYLKTVYFAQFCSIGRSLF